MLRPVRLVDQWREIVRELPEGWSDARLRLTIEDAGGCDRAAALLAPVNAGRRGNLLTFVAASHGQGPSPGTIESLLRRLDQEGLAGELELVGTEKAAAAPVKEPAKLAADWDASIAGLPSDWSDLYAELELVSTDWLDRAALLLAPVNPARYGEAPGFRFRVARRFGYGASAAMTRRCLERVDEEQIRGRLQILRVLSDTDPVATQGPVWYVDGRSV
jgi:hypothetical protein